jgi:putative CocE/NonD family hydrolase
MNQAGIADAPVERIGHFDIPIMGEQVGATRYSPTDAEGPLPAILMYIPYPKDDIITWGSYDPLVRYLAEHGYEVVVADMIGTGSSSGEWCEMFLRAEGEQGAEIIRWLAEQPWTDGTVGMIGKSYGGITALDAATLNPEPLKAIIPIHAPYLGYRNGFTYQGSPELSYIWMQWLTNMQALAVKPPDIFNSVESQRERWESRLATAKDRTPFLIQFNKHPKKDEYWGDKDIPVEDIHVPTLAVGGWRDSYTRDTIDYFEKLQGEKKLILGPWRHTMPHKGAEFAFNFREISRTWFDRFLKDEPVSIPGTEDILYWNETTPTSGFWGEIDSWPSPEDSPNGERELFLSREGLVSNSSQISSFTKPYEYDHSVGLETATPYNVDVPKQPICIDDQRSLVFDSAPLETPFDMLGSGEVSLRVTPSTEDVTLAARIEDVHPDGTANLVTKGALRGSCQSGIDACTAIEPDIESNFTVSLQPKAYRFREGHTIRLAVATAQFPDRYPIGGAGSLELQSSISKPSRVELMGKKATASKEKYVNAEKLRRKTPIEKGAIVSKDSSWKTFRDRMEDRVGVEFSKDMSLDLPYGSLHRERQHVASVNRRNSDELAVHNHLQIEMTFPQSTIHVDAKNDIYADRITFETVVVDDGETVFDQEWEAENSLTSIK